MIKTAIKPNDRHLTLLRSGKLAPEDVLNAASALKNFLKKHPRRTHQWCWRELGISKRLFYRFLAVSRWSKKVKKLVQDYPAPLSQTVLFKLADQKWKDARQLANKLKRIIAHLAERKKKSINKLKNSSDKVGAYLKSLKENPLQKKCRIFYMQHGELRKIEVTNLKQSVALVKNFPGFQGFVYPK